MISRRLFRVGRTHVMQKSEFLGQCLRRAASGRADWLRSAAVRPGGLRRAALRRAIPRHSWHHRDIGRRHGAAPAGRTPSSKH
jgi:hypothetical protein